MYLKNNIKIINQLTNYLIIKIYQFFHHYLLFLNMSSEENVELIKTLKEKTKENINNLLNENKIYKEEEIPKQYIKNHRLEYSSNQKKKPVPINIIFRSLYEPDTKCQISKSKLTFRNHLSSLNKDYNIEFDYKTYNLNSVPDFYKMSIEDSIKLFEEKTNIKSKISDISNYPQILEYNHIYQHPVPNPVFMGPKELKVNDITKIIFISPICFIVEIYSTNSGFSGMDSFYSALKYKFDMELNNDLSIKSTIMNGYFGLNFTKSCFFKNKIIESGNQQCEEGMTKKYLPMIAKELDLVTKVNSKKQTKNNTNKIESFIDETLDNEDSILDDFNGNVHVGESKMRNEGSGIMGKIFLLIFCLIFLFVLYFIIKNYGKEVGFYVIAALGLYYLMMINHKLGKLCAARGI